MKIKRQTIRSLSLHQRNFGLTALEVLTIRQVKVRLITAIRVKQSLILLLPQSTKKYLESCNIISTLVNHYLKLAFYVEENHFGINTRGNRARSIRIRDFAEKTLQDFFRFRSYEQLEKIIKYLQIPDPVRLENGCLVSSDAVLLVSLYRYHYPENASDQEAFFHLDYSICSRIFNYFLSFVVENWSYLLLNNMEYWFPKFPAFAEAIHKKIRQKDLDDPVNDNSLIFGFLDTTYQRFCKPGEKELARAVYTRHKKIFGAKFQVIMLPNGMQFHVHAAESARRHDSWILQNSGVIQKLRDLQEFSEQKYRIHGDPAYGADPPFLSSTGLGPVRVTIEQDFGETKDDFKIVNWARFLQLRKMKVAKVLLN
jgi:hypothetical protein